MMEMMTVNVTFEKTDNSGGGDSLGRLFGTTKTFHQDASVTVETWGGWVQLKARNFNEEMQNYQT